MTIFYAYHAELDPCYLHWDAWGSSKLPPSHQTGALRMLLLTPSCFHKQINVNRKADVSVDFTGGKLLFGQQGGRLFYF